MKHLRRLLVSLLTLVLLAQPALATWSIVLVNTKTGEVAVASATCLGNVNLIPDLPVVYPGLGAAAVQSARDRNGVRKMVIWDGFEAGKSPDEILVELKMILGNVQRQFGIVNFDDTPVTWTGVLVGEGKHGVVGIVGDLRYAIQGNVLVGPEPVDAAELALLSTPGDLGEKLIAAMEAAAAMGGDGRCSCSVTKPTSCGAPPPGTWKSAHTGFMIIGRVGDPPGVCTVNSGCAKGKYYFKANAIGLVSSPDPVITLRQKFDLWRAALAGRPDHILSVVSSSATALPANGVSQSTVVVQLIDLDGVPLTTGGATITFKNLSGAPDVTVPGAVIDHGDGSYEFTLTAGTTTGADLWELKFDDGVGKVRLFPQLAISVDPLSGLHVGLSSVSASQGAFVPLSLDLGAANAGARYRILGTTAGTVPGTSFMFQGAKIPLQLNRSALLGLSIEHSRGVWLNSVGTLDANGRATAGFVPAPGTLAGFVGGRIDMSSIVTLPSSVIVANPAGFDVLP